MNKLNTEKKKMVVSMLVEGSSIRSIERITGVHRDTIMRLGQRMGAGCEALMDSKMKGLHSHNVQIDELWGFVGAKKGTVRDDQKKLGMGDVWTFTAFDPDTKVVPCYRVGKRDFDNALWFISDLSKRIEGPVQLSSDQMDAYIDAIESVYGTDIDYGQIVKKYSTKAGHGTRVIACKKKKILGRPEKKNISTSLVERNNLTIRMHCRRLARKTNAFSKKLENFKSAIALHFGYYNFVKIHSSLRVTPAMAAGVSKGVWDISDLVEACGE